MVARRRVVWSSVIEVLRAIPSVQVVELVIGISLILALFMVDESMGSENCRISEVLRAILKDPGDGVMPMT